MICDDALVAQNFDSVVSLKTVGQEATGMVIPAGAELTAAVDAGAVVSGKAVGAQVWEAVAEGTESGCD